jgi:hypothetical protein
LQWAVPLPAGEQPAGAPLLDQSGRVHVGLGSAAAAGRLLVLSAEGTTATTVPLAGPPGESLALAPGLAVTVSRAGVVEQLGPGQEPAVAASRGGKVRILSWRFR